MPAPREYGAPPQVTPKGLADYLEAMSKSVMQAGISWAVVDKKWPGLREAFLDFDPQRLLSLSEREVKALLLDPRIIRNRAKVDAVFHNAARMLELEEEHGTFRKYLRSRKDYWDEQRCWARTSSHGRHRHLPFPVCRERAGARLRGVASRGQGEAIARSCHSSGAGCARNCHSSSES
jgi:3-methyladenine DNA glycosylase Tag